ncbi:MAG: Hsp20/alpha crystallin family protein [Planctomycetota bacterium]
MASKTSKAEAETPPAEEAKETSPAPAKTPAAPMPFAAFSAFPALREEMERLTQRFFGNDWMSEMSRLPSLGMDWPSMTRGAMPFSGLASMPKAAMSESDGGYELTVELPGMDEKDVQLTLSDNTLLLEAEHSAERKDEKKDYHFTERSYGHVRRRFPLPQGVDAEGMKASFDKGVLTVQIPKTEAAKSTPRRIPVGGG